VRLGAVDPAGGAEYVTCTAPGELALTATVCGVTVGLYVVPPAVTLLAVTEYEPAKRLVYVLVTERFELHPFGPVTDTLPATPPGSPLT
jgi:hypothetical protein